MTIQGNPFADPRLPSLDNGATRAPGLAEGFADGRAAVDIVRPPRQTAPVVVSSPHSGNIYPDDLVTRTRLDMTTLRSSEDCFVDELFAAAPELGIPMVKALFPRVYVDPNREPFEFDPAMFSDPLPDFVTTRTSRIAAGLGTIAKVVSNSVQIYGDKLTFADGMQRIRTCWRPFHDGLSVLIKETVDQFGFCVLVDAHSMPSNIQITGPDGRSRPVADIVIGDCHGTSCARTLSDRVTRVAANRGHRVERNTPYAGGYVTRNYGRPTDGVHAIQIEIKRGLYMTEDTLSRHDGFERIAADMRDIMAAVARFDPNRPLGDAD
jgi:N-formylglutamate deformylase